MKKIGVLTSGGDAPGMNSCIRAVVRTALFHNVEVVGIIEGYHGLIHGEMREMTARDVGGIIQRGGTILQTARSPEFRTKKGQREAIRELNESGIDGLIVVGGDGSLNGAHVLAQQGIRLVGVPDIGGRIMAYDLGPYPFFFIDPEFVGKLYTPEENQGDGSLAAWKNYGGDKTWPSPQGWDTDEQWPGPPDPVLDSGRYTLDEISSDGTQAVLCMTSPPDQHTGIQLTRKLTLARSSPAGGRSTTWNDSDSLRAKLTLVTGSMRPLAGTGTSSQNTLVSECSNQTATSLAAAMVRLSVRRPRSRA